jgi:hypothetical protein
LSHWPAVTGNNYFFTILDRSDQLSQSIFRVCDRYIHTHIIAKYYGYITGGSSQSASLLRLIEMARSGARVSDLYPEPEAFCQKCPD